MVCLCIGLSVCDNGVSLSVFLCMRSMLCFNVCVCVCVV